MNLIDAEKKVLLEVGRWFRELNRREELYPHEKRLYTAVVEMRSQLENVGPIPQANIPKTIHPPPLAGISGTRLKTNHDQVGINQISTKPIPPAKLGSLLKQTKLPPLEIKKSS